jgi:hypothetical protein
MKPITVRNNYVFEDIVESLRIVKEAGGWTSINYFVFPV